MSEPSGVVGILIFAGLATWFTYKFLDMVERIKRIEEMLEKKDAK